MAPTAKPTLAPLKTSKSPTFPSELHDSPLFSGKTESIKQEDFLRTPITPPTAYTDFLKTVTPIVASPSSSKDKSFDRLAVSISHSSTATSPYFCNCSNSCRKSPTVASITSSPVALHHHYRSSDRVRKTPTSAKPLRISAPSPKLTSPSFDSPRCCSARSPLPPPDWITESTARQTETPRCSSCSRPISVRHVITRTITYKRTALEPAPKGKRRKADE
ncbi:hypothetical protein H112_03558 [Trichophyton rubrum D6]|uniref:Uncharacterized protein n=3 Tax=Trichophyton rubrum TaxID=5551 RepID=A0A178EXJ4_TRIRU|nr:uncharacterized protein TERG_04883 [Trichophyton rubrum CBS 118892]EZF23778.1 hypothetical protein H100_03564 [Trichophyton rubrum MR850]EZF42844.1 hypothetical protein H102_03557 [Trichophyton rubrum CBS 100081]EZF53473.1 hypothetical protein H103_03567 [Trichophyton rubrum CBS 288.86]EZF64091.1 hypothetical protein H104_03554 [Trichophyton rubrum CBS 289.86]EZF85458.1 hypothetical protein H110_03565 [Trichophyton rubrum MR1448]EZF96235.1 hypothetical protein H113_03585 [Trichophyton rubr